VSAIFITGSGTDIGKTFVTAALIHEYRRRGRSIAALKPVASGFDPAAPEASDPGILLSALGDAITREALDQIAPWRFRAPLSPDMAAAREGAAIDFATLLQFCRECIAAARDLLLIEGVGGVMVPLDPTHTVLDWIAAISLPSVLVAGSYLGAVSHTLTALAALRQRDLQPRAILVNESPDSGVALDETAATIARFAAGIPVLALPRLPSIAAPHPALQHLADLL
jgi:dethiobiotin synthetase